MNHRHLSKDDARTIHEKLTAHLRSLFDRQPCDKCGVAKITDRELELIRKFLVDNEVGGVVIGPEALTDLADDLPFEEPDEPIRANRRAS